jgi:hypothetical protein
LEAQKNKQLYAAVSCESTIQDLNSQAQQRSVPAEDQDNPHCCQGLQLPPRPYSHAGAVNDAAASAAAHAQHELR